MSEQAQSLASVVNRYYGDNRTSNDYLPRNSSADGLIVPVRTLSASHIHLIIEHLKLLNAVDRHFRFGFLATDEQIKGYVDRLDFSHDEVFGVFDEHLKLIAMAHLGYSSATRCRASSEFGVSVSRHVRGRGYGTRLFDRAVMHARNEGVNSMYVHMLSENTAMLRIARRGGAQVVRDGADSEAHLRLPAATFQTQMSEMMEEHFAQTNYQIRAQAKHFWGQFWRFSHPWGLIARDGQAD